ncbi:MAG TPA: serine hydrolase [Pyrinomonadaceae bacterium]|nr:serine hydrolase [Pyrinomonadaceae bacterium]
MNMKRPNRNSIVKCAIALLVAGLVTGSFPSQACYASSNVNELRKQLETIASSFHGKIGISLHHLKTNDRLDLRGDEKFPTGSTIKVAMLCVVMEKVEKGELGYYQKFSLTEDDVSGGTGFLRNYKIGKQVTLKELLHQMITASDNTATRMVLKAIGSDATINDWLNRNGLKSTRLNVPYPISDAVWKDEAARRRLLEQYDLWGMGVSTPNEMRLLMEMIADGRAGTLAACDEMHRILNHQYFDDGIAGQIPPSVVVASKSGVEKNSRSDIAIVQAPSGTYVLAIYTKEAEDTRVTRDNEQDTAIRAIARAVWQHYQPESKWSPPIGAGKFSTGPDW